MTTFSIKSRHFFSLFFSVFRIGKREACLGFVENIRGFPRDKSSDDAGVAFAERSAASSLRQRSWRRTAARLRRRSPASSGWRGWLAPAARRRSRRGAVAESLLFATAIYEKRAGCRRVFPFFNDKKVAAFEKSSYFFL